MVVQALETAGSERILFGSDLMAWPPMIGLALDALLAIDELTHEDRRRILWSNAAKLFPLVEGRGR